MNRPPPVASSVQSFCDNIYSNFFADEIFRNKPSYLAKTASFLAKIQQQKMRTQEHLSDKPNFPNVQLKKRTDKTDHNASARYLSPTKKKTVR